MEQDYEIGPAETRAEFLLNYFYPEHPDQWQVENEGSFYRNYNRDLLSIDEELCTLRLARDGYLRLLPQGLLTEENELRKGDIKQKHEKLERRKQLLRDLFKPVDSHIFRTRLHIEKEIAKLLQAQQGLLLKQYFGYDLETETDPYVKKVAPLLPFISRLRADFGFLRDLLHRLLGFKVKAMMGRYTWEEGADCSQPMVRYEVIVPELTVEKFSELDRTLNPLRDFICEWFIPYDTYCVILLKYHGEPLIPGNKLLLDYNTETR